MANNVRCMKHPTYKGNYPPRLDCEPCAEIWRALMEQRKTARRRGKEPKDAA